MDGNEHWVGLRGQPVRTSARPALQAYIFNRLLYDGYPVYSAYQVIVLARSKFEAWTLLLAKDGHGIQSDWDEPEVKPLQRGVLTSFAEE